MLIFIEIQFDQHALHITIQKLFSKQLFVPKVDVGHLSALISFLNLWEKFPQYPATNHSAIGAWKLSLNPKQRFNHVQIQLRSTQINTNLLPGTQVLRLVVESHHSGELQLLKALI